jgi:uncharacterized protein YqjF (DUF2071 family)
VCAGRRWGDRPRGRRHLHYREPTALAGAAGDALRSSACGSGSRSSEPTALEHFVTARWGLHNAWFGGELYLPNAHPRWPLYRAELLDPANTSSIARGGATRNDAEPPISVLYSPGVPVRFGPPARRPVAR